MGRLASRLTCSTTFRAAGFSGGARGLPLLHRFRILLRWTTSHRSSSEYRTARLCERMGQRRIRKLQVLECEWKWRWWLR